MQSEPQSDGPLVMVAEDDVDIRELLQGLLGDEGYRVRATGDGVAALDIAVREGPAAIVLDLGLPGMAGPDFCRAYRERGGRAPVVLVTAANSAIVETAMQSCGAAAYIRKPFDIEDIMDMLERLVRP